MPNPLHVLFAGVSADDMEMMLLELQRAGFDPSAQRVETAEAMDTALEQSRWDAILADDAQSSFDALSALGMLQDSGLDLPLIVISGNSDVERAAEMMRAGAKDYLLRSSLSRLGPAVERELWNTADRRARKTAEANAFRLAAIVHNAEDAIIGKDLNGVITSWNPAAERLYGWTAAEAIGRHISIVVPHYLETEVASFMERLMRGERIVRHQTVRCRKDGKEFQVCLSILPIRDSGGKLVGASTFVQDLTERKRLDDELRMSELRFRCLFQSDAVAMGCWNIDGHITDGNSALLRLIGYTREEMDAGKVNWIDMTPPEHAHLDARALEEMRATGTCRPFEKEYIRKDRSRVPVLIAAAVYGDGITDAGAFFAVDLTERKKIEYARQQQSRILNSILTSMGEAVVAVDEHGKFLLFNAAAEQIIGIGAIETEPAMWSEGYGLYSSDQVTRYPFHDLPLARAMRGENVDATELFVRNEGAPHGRWISATARPLRNEAGDLCGGVAVLQDITGRKRAEDTQRILTADRDNLMRRLELQIQRLPLAYMVFDPEMRVLEWNPAAEKTFGYTREEMLGTGPPYEEFVPRSFWQLGDEIRSRVRSGDMYANSTNENLTKDGRTITCEWFNTPLLDCEGRFTGMLSLARDITEHKNLEEQLRQAQKMEAIGRLAGGIAHDFNNFLAAINIYNHLLIESLDREHPAQQLLQELGKATERSASMTRQLLAFSRKQVLSPQILCFNEVVRDTEQMLSRLICEDIQLVTFLDPRLDSVKADPEQMQRVLLNLVVNARDAMPHGGKLTIETTNVVLDGINSNGYADIPSGRYVMLAVTDSGVGMSPQVKRQIFEPFFSTKESARGSGLGLFVVQGIVKLSEGHILVDSEPGRGACFKICLPRVEQLPLPRESSPVPVQRLRGTETILLVEDDEILRKATCSVLRGYGYNVLNAGDGDEALSVSSQHPELISLLVTDVVMPRLGGRMLSERLRALRPELKTLYVSGYADDAVLRHDVAHEQAAFVHKPFSPVSLGLRIREVLDGA